MDKTSGVCRLQRDRSLRDDIENPVDRKRAFAFEHRGQRLTWNEFHDEVGATVFLAIVVHIGNTLVIDQGGVTRFGTEAL